MTSAVTLKEIERIFEVIDRLGLSRERVVIPLRSAVAGCVRRLPDGRFEIVVDCAVGFETWLAGLASELRAYGFGEDA